MKKWAAIILLSLLCVISLPELSEANQGKNFEKDLQTYLKDVSKIRGFDVTKNDIEYSLSLYEMSLDDFADVAELKDYLGEVISKDGSNLEEIYEEYEIGIAELEALLKEYGETLDDYVFVYDLWVSVDLYIPRDPNFDENLEIWLKEVSKIRGFKVTRGHIEHSLALYDATMDEFKRVKNLSNFLGEVIEKDLGNIAWLYEELGMDKQEFLQLLKDNQLDINNYVFVDDLMTDVYDVIGWGEDNLEEELAQIMAEFGLTEEELNRLEKHFLSIEDSLLQEETIERLINLAERMMAFEDFDTATDLTAEQLLELLSIYKEFLSIFQLKVEYALVQSGTEKPLSLEDLFGMKELVNANLLIKIYNLQGEFLADLLITGEMVDSDSLHQVGKDMKNVLNEKPSEKSAPAKETIVKPAKESGTEKGARLPNTAGNFAEKSIGWLLVSLVGMTLLFRMRKIGSEK